MTRPSVGDLIMFTENGVNQLAIVTGHGPQDTIHVHVFNTSHFTIHPGHYHSLNPEQEVKKKA